MSKSYLTPLMRFDQSRIDRLKSHYVNSAFLRGELDPVKRADSFLDSLLKKDLARTIYCCLVRDGYIDDPQFKLFLLEHDQLTSSSADTPESMPPSKSSKSPKLVHFNDIDLGKAEVFAEQNNCSVSHLIRVSLSEYLKRFP